jgi:hypothetical protein
MGVERGGRKKLLSLAAKEDRQRRVSSQLGTVRVVPDPLVVLTGRLAAWDHLVLRDLVYDALTTHQALEGIHLLTSPVRSENRVGPGRTKDPDLWLHKVVPSDIDRDFLVEVCQAPFGVRVHHEGALVGAHDHVCFIVHDFSSNPSAFTK